MVLPLRPVSKRLTQVSRKLIIKPVVIPATGLILSPSRTQANRFQLPQKNHKDIKTCRFHSTSRTMSSSAELKQTLTPALLDDVHTFWFDHLSDEESLVLPGWSEMGKWFTRDEAFDKACVDQFRPVLQTIIGSKASASDILSAVNPSSPLHWLSIILLLDQIPRNCYRGDESKVVFGYFDPLAEEIALQALDQGIPTQSPYFKYRLAYRTWFHMPLMHSESLAAHEQAIKMHEDTAREMNDLLAMDPSTLGEEDKKCHSALKKKSNELQAFLSQTFDYEKRHKVIIERFGRYPHRNQALGRVSTPEETEYLENGGETFG